MLKINVKGLNGREEREFEIMERKELEKILDNVDFEEVYKKTLELAEGYTFSGSAYAYLDARDGEVKTCWLQQNNYHHPYDSFYEITLCRIETPAPEPTENDLLIDEEEFEQFESWQYENTGTVEEFIEETMGVNELNERIDTWKDCEAMEFEPDWDSVKEQLNILFSKAEMKYNWEELTDSDGYFDTYKVAVGKDNSIEKINSNNAGFYEQNPFYKIIKFDDFDMGEIQDSEHDFLNCLENKLQG